MNQTDQFTAILNIVARMEGVSQVESGVARVKKALASAQTGGVSPSPALESQTRAVAALAAAYKDLDAAQQLTSNVGGKIRIAEEVSRAASALGVQVKLLRTVTDGLGEQFQAIARWANGKALPSAYGPQVQQRGLENYRQIGTPLGSGQYSANLAVASVIDVFGPKLASRIGDELYLLGRRLQAQIAIGAVGGQEGRAADARAIVDAFRQRQVLPAREASIGDRSYMAEFRKANAEAIQGYFAALRQRDVSSGRSGLGASDLINWLESKVKPGNALYETGVLPAGQLTPRRVYGRDDFDTRRLLNDQLAEFLSLTTGRDGSEGLKYYMSGREGRGLPVAPGGFASFGEPDPTKYFPPGQYPGDASKVLADVNDRFRQLKQWAQVFDRGLPELPVGSRPGDALYDVNRGFTAAERKRLDEEALARSQSARLGLPLPSRTGDVYRYGARDVPESFQLPPQVFPLLGAIDRLQKFLTGQYDDALTKAGGTPSTAAGGAPILQQLQREALAEAQRILRLGGARDEVQARLEGRIGQPQLSDFLDTATLRPYTPTPGLAIPPGSLIGPRAALVQIDAGKVDLNGPVDLNPYDRPFNQFPPLGAGGQPPAPPGGGGRRPAIGGGGGDEDPRFLQDWFDVTRGGDRVKQTARALEQKRAQEGVAQMLDKLYTSPASTDELLNRLRSSETVRAQFARDVDAGKTTPLAAGGPPLTRQQEEDFRKYYQQGVREIERGNAARKKEADAAERSARAQEKAAIDIQEALTKARTLGLQAQRLATQATTGPIKDQADLLAREAKLETARKYARNAQENLNAIPGIAGRAGVPITANVSQQLNQLGQATQSATSNVNGMSNAFNAQKTAWQATAAGGGTGGGGSVPPQGPTYGPGFSASGNPNNRTPGFIGDFERGFRGRGERPYAEQIGQAFKFSLFYGTAYSLLFRITQTLSTALDQSIQFEKAFVELNIAMGDGVENTREIANKLGDIAASAGFSGAEGVIAGARAIGLFDLRGESAAVQEAGAKTNVRVVAQTAFATGQEFQTIQRNLGAIAQAFGGGYESLTRFQDLDAFLTKANGLVTGSTFETVAQVGSLGKEAGFNEEEIFSLAAKIQSRTGQTPAAVAGLLSQFFGRAGDPSLRSKLGGVGVDTSKSYRDQIEQLSQKDLTPALRNLILNSFGRGRSGQAASIIVSGFEGITADAEAAKTGSAGLGQKQFEERMKSIAGEVARFIGAVKDLALDLADTGLIDIFGYLAAGATRLIEAIDGVVELFNLLPRPIRDVIIGLGALALAYKLAIPAMQVRAGYGYTDIASGRTSSVLRGMPAFAGGTQPIYAMGPGGKVPLGVEAIGADGKPTVVGRQVGTVPLPLPSKALAGEGLPTGRFAGLKVAGSAAFAAMGGPVGLAILGLVGFTSALGAAKNKLDEVAEAQKAATDSRRTFSEATTVEDFRTAASSLRASAETLGSANDGFWGAILAGSKPDKDAARLESNADYADELADRLETEQRLAAAMKETSVFGDSTSRTSEDIAYGFELLALQGASAKEQLDLFRESIAQTGEEASKATFEPVQFGVDQTAALFGLQSDQEFQQLPGTRPAGKIGLPGTLGVGAVSPEKGGFQPLPVTLEEILAGADAEAVNKAILAQTARTNTVDGISDAEYTKIAEAAVGTIPMDGLVDPDAVKQAIIDMLLEQFKSRSLGNLIEASQLTTQQGIAELQIELQRQSGIKSSGMGTAGLKAKAQADLDAILTLQSKTNQGESTGEFIYQVQEAKIRLGEATLEDLDAVRRAAQNKATSESEIESLGRSTVNAAIQVAVDTGNTNMLVDIINDADAAAVAVARAAIQRAREAALAAVKSARARLAAVYADAQQSGLFSDSREANALGQVPSDAAQAARDKELADLEAGLARTMPVGTKDSTRLSGSDANRPKASDTTGPTAAQIAAARARAEAARTGGGVEEALAAIQTAQADMAAAKKNTVEFYSALASLYQAQQQLRDAVRQRQLTRALLTIDLTDPLQEASAELQSAREKLAEDRARGASSDVIEADALEVRRGEINVENTRWQQFLSDLQTNEQLKRITHRQYMDTLEAERQRLLAVAVRTRQQQDQLNEIEGLIQAANEAAAGQFNLGDINLPTPYQARRMVQGQLGGLGGAAATTVSNVNITVDGADTGFVLQVLGQYLGQPVIQSATTASRRV